MGPKSLTEQEKGYILELREENVPVKEISERIGKSKSTVYSFIARAQEILGEYSSRHSLLGCPRKTLTATNKLLKRETLKNPKIAAKQVKQADPALGKVAVSTIQQPSQNNVNQHHRPQTSVTCKTLLTHKKNGRRIFLIETVEKKSEDSTSADNVPSSSSSSAAKEKKTVQLALLQYNKWKKSIRRREKIKKRKELVKSKELPSLVEIKIEDTSASVSGENTTSDCETLSVTPGLVEYKAECNAVQKEHQELRDQLNIKEPLKSISSPFSCFHINSSNTTPDATFIPEEKLVDDEYHFNEGSSDDSDDGNKDVKYEDPATLLLTGKTKELMRLLQVYRKNTSNSGVSEEHQKLSERREWTADSDATAQMEQALGQHATSSEKRFKEHPLNERQTIRIDNVTYMNLLTHTQEKAFVQYIANASKINTGITLEEICHIVCNFCLDTKIAIPPAWLANRFAAMEWVKGFIRRHEICYHFPSNKNGCDKCSNGSCVRRSLLLKQGLQLDACEDGSVCSMETASEPINLEHSYAVKPGAKVLLVKYVNRIVHALKL